jgi:hypothetical protein
MSGNGTPSPVKSGAGILGAGAAACVACCAGPILGALSAVGIATAAGYLIAGTTALVVGIAAVTWLIYRRRRRQRTGCSTSTASSVTRVAGPTMRASTTGTARDESRPHDADSRSDRGPLVNDAG